MSSGAFRGGEGRNTRMYDALLAHTPMLADRVRVGSYEKAIREVVRSGDVVADIGTGTGILAFLAVQAGARKVYAVEQGDVIEDARKLAEINGLAQNIVFIKGMSDKIELPEKVDVIVSEIMGSFGLDESVLKFKVDARRRFLKPGGTLIPSWLELHVVPVESEAIWRDHAGLFSSDYYGLDLSPVRDRAVLQSFVTDCAGKVNQLATPSPVSRMDLCKLEKTPPAFEGRSVIGKKAPLHGLMGYFRAGLSPSIVLSTAPDQPPTHWKQTFFPVGNEFPVQDEDVVHYRMTPIPQMNTVFWQWRTSIERNGTRIAEFSHSNLDISKEELAVGRESFIPVLTPEGEIRGRVLHLCDGKRTMAEIADVVQSEYADKYKNFKAAMQGVVRIVRSVVRLQ